MKMIVVECFYCGEEFDYDTDWDWQEHYKSYKDFIKNHIFVCGECS